VSDLQGEAATAGKKRRIGAEDHWAQSLADRFRNPTHARVTLTCVHIYVNKRSWARVSDGRSRGKSRAYVTQSLGGDHNMTLSTFAGFADALNADAILDARPRESSDGKLIPTRPATATPAAQKGTDYGQRTQRRAENEQPLPRKRR
jgi:hypothetical protein